MTRSPAPGTGTGGSPWRRYRPFWRTSAVVEVDDELAFHLAMRVRDLEASGLSPEQARAEAEQLFGDLRDVRDACLLIDQRRQRKATRSEMAHHMWQDLKFAGRALRKAPAFSAMTMLCIALGVAVATTIFSAVNAILLKPLPFPAADRLVAVYDQNVTRGYHETNISYPDYVSWRDDNHSFSALGIWTWTNKTLTQGESERLYGTYVSANLFPLLGVQPLLGRNFLPAEERRGNDHVAIISFGVWQRAFGGDKGIVGKQATIDAMPYTVVGVMPRNFNFPDRGQIWLPFAPGANEGRSNRGYAGAIGRLAPGVSVDAAKADLATVSSQLENTFVTDNTGWAAELVPLRDDLTGTLRRPLFIFLGAVLLVLLIACANVANLMLARGASRYREVAIRIALGAGRGRIVRQLLTESMLIAAVGGSIGAAAGMWGVRLLQFAFPNGVPFYVSLETDPRAVMFALVVIAATGVLCGIIPAVRTSRADVGVSLREGARGGEAGARVSARNALVVGETALSVVLMVGAMLLIRSYGAYEGTNLGFDETGILTARITLPTARYGTNASRIAFFGELTQRLRALPSVTMVGSAQGIPLSGWNVQGAMSVYGRPPARLNEEVVSHFQPVSPEYFATIGVPLRRGRMLAETDRDTLAPVGVVNEKLVAALFPGQNPIGKRVKIGSPTSPYPWITIVGVVRDYRHYTLPQPMGPAIFTPYAQSPSTSQTFAIRTSRRDPATLTAEVRRVVHDLDPQVAPDNIRTMEDIVGQSLWRQRLQGQVLGTFAALALLLAIVGIYGVISYAVAQRTRDIAVRLALGAQPSQVLGMVLRQGAALAALGIGIGLLAALALSRTLATLLYGVSTTDVVSFAVVPLALASVTMLATYVPARRATRVDPLLAMRAD